MFSESDDMRYPSCLPVAPSVMDATCILYQLDLVDLIDSLVSDISTISTISTRSEKSTKSTLSTFIYYVSSGLCRSVTMWVNKHFSTAFSMFKSANLQLCTAIPALQTAKLFILSFKSFTSSKSRDL